MNTIENVRDGVMAIPILAYENGVATLMVIGPLEENGNKLGERCLLDPNSVMESLTNKQEFPGGGIKPGESLEQGFVRELGVETKIGISEDVFDRIKFVFEGVPIDQLRPNLTHFSVSVALWFVNITESVALGEKGAQKVLLDVIDGTLTRESDLGEVVLRPAHRDIINHVCMIARSLVMQQEGVLNYEESIAN